MDRSRSEKIWKYLESQGRLEFNKDEDWKIKNGHILESDKNRAMVQLSKLNERGYFSGDPKEKIYGEIDFSGFYVIEEREKRERELLLAMECREISEERIAFHENELKIWKSKLEESKEVIIELTILLVNGEAK
jgi:hypothetical protein